MELEKIVEYFCDTIGTITDHGGTDDLNWYEVDIQPVEQHASGQKVSSEPVRARYAVHKGWDESGYSGRERLSVRF
jgi:hypothetical protein